MAPRRFSVEEYYELARIGILGPDERVELIEGQIIPMSPAGSRHAELVSRFTHALMAGLPEDVRIRPQCPVRFDGFSELEPDLALVRVTTEGFWARHPHPKEVLLIVEVAESSLRRDRHVKLPLYARAGIPEVWIVDVATLRMEVHRQPDDGAYREVAIHDREASVSPALVPNVRVEMRSVIPDVGGAGCGA